MNLMAKGHLRTRMFIYLYWIYLYRFVTFEDINIFKQHELSELFIYPEIQLISINTVICTLGPLLVYVLFIIDLNNRTSTLLLLTL